MLYTRELKKLALLNIHAPLKEYKINRAVKRLQMLK